MAAGDGALAPEAVGASHGEGRSTLTGTREGEEGVLWASRRRKGLDWGARVLWEVEPWEASPQGDQRDEQGGLRQPGGQEGHSGRGNEVSKV